MSPAESHMTVHVTPEIHYAQIPDEELTRRFTYHAPSADQVQRHAALRAAALDLARTISMMTPPSPEQTAALQHLDEAVFCANAAIARREP